MLNGPRELLAGSRFVSLNLKFIHFIYSSHLSRLMTSATNATAVGTGHAIAKRDTEAAMAVETVEAGMVTAVEVVATHAEEDALAPGHLADNGENSPRNIIIHNF